MKTDPLQDFILKDEQNLRIAVAISEAWPEVRSRITTTFLDRLTTKLVKELPGWTTETWETFFEHAYASFTLYKPTWEYYWVDLQFRDCGQNMRLGIVREESLISDRPFSPDILEAVRNSILQPNKPSGGKRFSYCVHQRQTGELRRSFGACTLIHRS
jgi:hypothetical protein